MDPGWPEHLGLFRLSPALPTRFQFYFSPTKTFVIAFPTSFPYDLRVFSRGHAIKYSIFQSSAGWIYIFDNYPALTIQLLLQSKCLYVWEIWKWLHMHVRSCANMHFLSVHNYEGTTNQTNYGNTLKGLNWINWWTYSCLIIMVIFFLGERMIFAMCLVLLIYSSKTLNLLAGLIS